MGDLMTCGGSFDCYATPCGAGGAVDDSGEDGHADFVIAVKNELDVDAFWPASTCNDGTDFDTTMSVSSGTT